jgi:hypothetical protein
MAAQETLDAELVALAALVFYNGAREAGESTRGEVQTIETYEERERLSQKLKYLLEQRELAKGASWRKEGG